MRQSNGGEVEKIEKNAEIIIADGVRKDAPPGSISWKFIEESAKAGKLVDMEEYRCGASERAPERANAQPAKSTRTPFTAEDDRILTQWVLEGERLGRKIKGNELYIELAERVWNLFPDIQIIYIEPRLIFVVVSSSYISILARSLEEASSAQL